MGEDRELARGFNRNPQIGLLVDPRLPVLGAETAKKVADPRFNATPAKMNRP